ncbi:MAG: glycosyltransferase [Rubrivivax sp.]|nr:MAG: glycosyltransferase [Rubrivivax sp.]
MNSASQALSILHVVDSLEFGGLERVVTDLAITQQSHGHRVAVFSINTTTGFARELTAVGIPVHQGHKQGTLDWKVIQSLRHAASSMKADIVHAHNFVPNYYAALALLAWWRAPKLVNTCHDMGTRLSHKRLKFLFESSLRRTARVAMVGQQVFDRYTQSGMVPASRADTVLNGIPIDRFVATPERRQQARHALGLPQDALVIGCVGRLVGLKNHRLLVKLLPDLVQAYPGLRLVIVGYGELHEALNAQAAELGVSGHVLVTGQRSDVADLLPAFDVFALPSLTEGLSIALLEACATGLAVLASDVGGNPEIIKDGQTGVLVGSDDAQATHAALLTLLGDAPLRGKLGHTAQQWVREHASTEALHQAYDRFYRSALGSAPRAPVIATGKSP